jgi:hypothetical protein
VRRSRTAGRGLDRVLELEKIFGAMGHSASQALQIRLKRPTHALPNGVGMAPNLAFGMLQITDQTPIGRTRSRTVRATFHDQQSLIVVWNPRTAAT